MKILLLIILVVIVGSLFTGLVFLIKDQDGSDRTVKALTWRIGLSLALFILLMVAYFTGIITPNAVSV